MTDHKVLSLIVDFSHSMAFGEHFHFPSFQVYVTLLGHWLNNLYLSKVLVLR